MTWVKLDDLFAEHPKVAGLSDKAFRMHVSCLLWSARYLTDGRIPNSMKRGSGMLHPAKAVAELEAAGLWNRDGDDWVINDYLEYNPPRTEVLASREIARRRSAMNANPKLARAIKERDGNNCRYCGVHVNWRDRKSSSGGTYDHVVPVSQGGDESLDNLVVACRDCNGRKGPRTPEQAEMVLLDALQPESRRLLNGSQTTPSRTQVPVLELPSIEDEIKGSALDVRQFIEILNDADDQTEAVLSSYARRLPEAAFYTALESLAARKLREPVLVSETRYFVATLNSMVREEQYA